MAPAAGADCASWISENMVERSEGGAAAIPAADTAGCSRLMGEDDARKRVPITASGWPRF